MAKIKNGMLSGLVGNVVTTSWKGTPILKIQNEDVEQPRTDAQEKNWNGFGIISAFCSRHKQMIMIGFQKPLKASYPMNEARSLNAPKHTVTGQWPDISVHYDKLQLASGLIPAPIGVNANINGNSLLVNWNPDEKAEFADGNDYVNVAFHYPDEEQISLQAIDHFCIAQRKDGTVLIPLDDRPAHNFHAWMFYFNPLIDKDPNRLKVSNSVYLGGFKK